MSFNTPQQTRNLSPITELTTPASLSSFGFFNSGPFDYSSDHEDDGEISPRSHASGHTILAGLPEPIITDSLPFGPSPCSTDVLPPISTVSPVADSQPFKDNASQLSEGGKFRVFPLPPKSPPNTALPGVYYRDQDTVHPSSSSITIRQTERYLPDLIHSSDEIKSERPDVRVSSTTSLLAEEEDAGLAGIGAGMLSRRSNLTSWPLLIDLPGTSEVKRRPNTYHGVESSRDDPESLDDAISDDPGSPIPAFPQFILSSNHLHPDISLARTDIPPDVNRRTTITSYRLFKSDPSLPIVNPTTTGQSLSSQERGPKSPPKGPTRSRMVSNLFLHLFGSEDPSASPQSNVIRRLSKRRRRKSDRSSAGVKSLTNRPEAPSPTPTGPNPVPPKTASRLSGTFGIHDDGSDLFVDDRPPADNQSPPTLPSGISRKAGSVQSLHTEKTLYIEHEHHGVNNDETGRKTTAEMTASPVAAHLLTPPDSGKRDMRRIRVHTPPLATLSPSLPFVPSIDSSAHPHLNNPTRTVDCTNCYMTPPSKPFSFPQDVHSSSERRIQGPVNVDVAHAPRYLVDKGVQTSPTTRRPLPRTPIAQFPVPTQLTTFISPSAQPEVRLPPPTFQPPGPVSGTSTGASVSPLLLASRELLRHASALLQLPRQGDEGNDTVSRIAKENLRWSSWLMNVVEGGDSPKGPPKREVESNEETKPIQASFNNDTGLAINDPAMSSDVSGSSLPSSLVAVAAESDTLVPLRVTQHAGSRSELSTDTRRTIEASPLPLDWLSEVERLGHEGFASLHRAEEVWNNRIKVLRNTKEKLFQSYETEPPLPSAVGSSGLSPSDLITGYTPSTANLTKDIPSDNATHESHSQTRFQSGDFDIGYSNEELGMEDVQMKADIKTDFGVSGATLNSKLPHSKLRKRSRPRTTSLSGFGQGRQDSMRIRKKTSWMGCRVQSS